MRSYFNYGFCKNFLKVNYTTYLKNIILASLVWVNTTCVPSINLSYNLGSFSKQNFKHSTSISESSDKYSYTKGNYYAFANHKLNNLAEAFLDTNSRFNIMSNKMFNNNDTNYSTNSLASAIVSSYAANSNGEFSDNNYFRMLRKKDAVVQIKNNLVNFECNPNDSTIIIINKTFQKAMIAKIERNTNKSSSKRLSSCFINDSNDFCDYLPRIFNKKHPLKYSSVSELFPKSVNQLYIYELNSPKRDATGLDLYNTVATGSNNYIAIKIILEIDCSTAKIYGPKISSGDGKTPEGLFFISKLEDSHDWLYDGLLMYGPKFMRIKNSIGIHGTGTDVMRNASQSVDKRYSAPEPLGIYNNNFGVGLSHGCIRFENNILDSLVENNLLHKGNPVIIFENAELTRLLSRYYPRSKELIYKSKTKINATNDADNISDNNTAHSVVSN